MKDIPGYIKFSILALGIGLVISAMILAKVLLVPMVWALLLTLMVLPVAEWWERRLKRRALAAMISVFMLIILVGAVLTLLTSQVMSLTKDAPELEAKVGTLVEEVRSFADEKLGISVDEQDAALKEQLPSSTGTLITKLGNTVTNTLTVLGLLVLVPIYMFFFLCYRERFLEFVIRISAARKAAHTVGTLIKASKIVQKYLRGVGIELVVMTVLSGIVFFSLGIKHALFFAVMVAVLNIIPYVGVLIGTVISVTYTFLTTDSVGYPIAVFGLLWLIQIVDNNFIAPYIVGQQIRLNPLAVILAVILGGLIWGISGMIIFIPVLGMAKVVFDESESLKPYGYLLGGNHEGKDKNKDKDKDKNAEAGMEKGFDSVENQNSEEDEEKPKDDKPNVISAD